MYQIGIDIGSTYTKYCIMNGSEIVGLFSEKTPIRQKDFFAKKTEELRRNYPRSIIASCGYGKNNVESFRSINELTALSKGSYYLTSNDTQVLDIGGQDTKLIQQRNGILTDFFISDKCAAGSGLFLSAVLEQLGMSMQDVNLIGLDEPSIHLSATCAVFAQSEIVELIADNRNESEIVEAVIWQILVKARALLDKVGEKQLLLSGGLTTIPGFTEYAKKALNRDCYALPYSPFISAIGCAVGLVD